MPAVIFVNDIADLAHAMDVIMPEGVCYDALTCGHVRML